VAVAARRVVTAAERLLWKARDERITIGGVEVVGSAARPGNQENAQSIFPGVCNIWVVSK
jgi:hypothetical protein